MDLLPALPSIDPVLTQLAQLVTASSPPSAIFLHTLSNPALLPALLPSFLRSVLPPTENTSVQDLLPSCVFLDLRVLLTPRAVFDKALNVLSGWEDGGGAVWNDRAKLVRNWDGRVKGVSVVNASEEESRKRKALSQRRGKKKVRRQEVVDDEEEEDDDVASEGEQVKESYKIKWTPSAALLPPRDPLAPLPNTPDAFHASLRTILSLRADTDEQDETDNEGTPRRRFLIFVHGELLHDLAGGGGAVGGAPKETGLGMTFASTMYRLEQLADVPVTTIVLSSLSWIKAREGMVGLASPTVLTVPELSPADARTLLAHRFSQARPSSDAALFAELVSLVHTTFGSTTSTSIPALSPLLDKLHPTLLAIIEKDNLSTTNIPSLHNHLKETDTMKNLLNPPKPSAALMAAGPPNEQLLPLPAVAKILLIAAFLAGVNPPKSDVKCFVKIDERVVKKGSKTRKVKSKPGSPSKGKVRADLTAGKAFPLERLIAIFEAILPKEYENASGSPSILTQIATLLRLRLLVKTSATDKLLDGVKLRSRLSRDVVHGLALSIKMKDWKLYLVDGGDE